MITTIEGIYKDGKIELSETPAGIEQTQVLVTFLPRLVSVAQPQKLYGVWKDKIAPDFDVDAALKEVRGEWTQEWETDAHE